MLQIERLSASYGSVVALRNVSIEVKPQELVAVIGALGAGKSTLLKCISGLMPYRAEKVAFLNHDLRGIPGYKIVRLGIAHVPERRQLFDRLNVYQNLQMGAYPLLCRREGKVVREYFDYVFSLFPILAERKEQVAGTLSGGEQQMLAIARGLLAAPKLLMVDEPSLGLAPVVAQSIKQALLSLSRQGLTILLVEENVTFALAANRVYLMDQGSIVTEGSPDGLMASEQIKRIYFAEKEVSEE